MKCYEAYSRMGLTLAFPRMELRGFPDLEKPNGC